MNLMSHMLAGRGHSWHLRIACKFAFSRSISECVILRCSEVWGQGGTSLFCDPVKKPTRPLTIRAGEPLGEVP
jgi:hypothetical protein